MNLPDASPFNIGPRLTFAFLVLLALILGGNALLIWQFHIARLQTDRLNGVSQQVIAILRLQRGLRSFHQRLDELTFSRDASRLAEEAGPLRATLLDQTKRTKAALLQLSSKDVPLDPAFIPTLEAIEIALPSQLEAITALASSGDWDAVRLRLANEMKPLEVQISALVENIDKEVSSELAKALVNMDNVQNRILFIVPATAIVTFILAAFFGWATSRRIVELRMQERVNERSRIARELHDTLLQGFISVSMQLDVAMEQLPPDFPAKASFERAQKLTGQVIEEGRNAVRGFRTSDAQTQALEHAFSQVPQELNLKRRVDFHVIVEGHPQLLHPAVRNEVYSIGREALLNSFRHSGASRVEVELEYTPTQLRVFVRDNGCGIDDDVLQSGREGHWGLSTMRERAERIGAKLKALSRTGAGTEVELRVPANIAFESHSPT
jgi:signal transduction histidine kinase